MVAGLKEGHFPSGDSGHKDLKKTAENKFDEIFSLEKIKDKLKGSTLGKKGKEDVEKIIAELKTDIFGKAAAEKWAGKDIKEKIIKEVCGNIEEIVEGYELKPGKKRMLIGAIQGICQEVASVNPTEPIPPTSSESTKDSIVNPEPTDNPDTVPNPMSKLVSKVNSEPISASNPDKKSGDPGDKEEKKEIIKTEDKVREDLKIIQTKQELLDYLGTLKALKFRKSGEGYNERYNEGAIKRWSKKFESLKASEDFEKWKDSEEFRDLPWLLKGKFRDMLKNEGGVTRKNNNDKDRKITQKDLDAYEMSSKNNGDINVYNNESMPHDAREEMQKIKMRKKIKSAPATADAGEPSKVKEAEKQSEEEKKKKIEEEKKKELEENIRAAKERLEILRGELENMQKEMDELKKDYIRIKEGNEKSLKGIMAKLTVSKFYIQKLKDEERGMEDKLAAKGVIYKDKQKEIEGLEKDLAEMEEALKKMALGAGPANPDQAAAEAENDRLRLERARKEAADAFAYMKEAEKKWQRAQKKNSGVFRDLKHMVVGGDTLHKDYNEPWEAGKDFQQKEYAYKEKLKEYEELKKELGNKGAKEKPRSDFGKNTEAVLDDLKGKIKNVEYESGKESADSGLLFDDQKYALEDSVEFLTKFKTAVVDEKDRSVAKKTALDAFRKAIANGGSWDEIKNLNFTESAMKYKWRGNRKFEIIFKALRDIMGHEEARAVAGNIKAKPRSKIEPGSAETLEKWTERVADLAVNEVGG